ncbi:hypothetical protein NESM_000133600 [Novymonas esmeraldas]|uniref:Uncharacterized protein n=1 Tax=Novymonas esmeraldas TaxID=1808958 RepID=A0AAW0F3K3_9TRYP
MSASVSEELMSTRPSVRKAHLRHGVTGAVALPTATQSSAALQLCSNKPTLRLWSEDRRRAGGEVVAREVTAPASPPTSTPPHEALSEQGEDGSPAPRHPPPMELGSRAEEGGTSYSAPADLTREVFPPADGGEVPPALPSHPPVSGGYTSGNYGGEREEGIVESTRSYLARLSLEDAVVALERLQFLMMAHTAAVTTRSGSASDGASPPPPVRACPSAVHVDPFKLSKRPLEDIAEELCTQLRELSSTYEVASAAERWLMGVGPSRSEGVPDVRQLPAGDGDAAAAPLSRVEPGLNEDMMGTFGPMISTQLIATVRSDAEVETNHSGDTGDSWGAIDLNKANPGPSIAYKPQRPSLPPLHPPQQRCNGGAATGAAASVSFTYPDGTTVCFPTSTFGELVSTQSGLGTTQASPLLATGTGTSLHFPTVSASTQTEPVPRTGATGAPPVVSVNVPVLSKRGPSTCDGSTAATGMDSELLHSYLTALESRLSEKQRLEALEEARGNAARKLAVSYPLNGVVAPLSR